MRAAQPPKHAPQLLLFVRRCCFERGLLLRERSQIRMNAQALKLAPDPRRRQDEIYAARLDRMGRHAREARAPRLLREGDAATVLDGPHP